MPWSETVRGYEYAKGEYVDADRRGLREASAAEPAHHRPERVRRRVTEIDPVYYERSYYLAPGRAGGEGRTRCCSGAGARRGSPRSPRSPSGRRSSSARSAPGTASSCWRRSTTRTRCGRNMEVDLDGARVSERELEMAFTLIELLRKPFEPEEYHDHYREALAAAHRGEARGTRSREVAGGARDQGHRPGRRAPEERRGGPEGWPAPGPAAKTPASPSGPAGARTRKVS